MEPWDIKKAGNFFDKKHQDLYYILTKIKHLNAIYDSLSRYLEPQIASQCKVANIHNRRLTLVVSNGAIASHIRLLQHELLAKMKSDAALNYIKELHCKVDPSLQNVTQEAQTITHKPTLLSSETSKMMAEIAQSINYPALQKIMLSIAAKVKK